MPVDARLLDKLACPQCKTPFIQRGEGAALLCVACDKEYPVIKNIPILKPDASGLNSDRIIYTGNHQLRGEPSKPVTVIRKIVASVIRYQKPLIPVTPLNPLYHIRQFNGYYAQLPSPKAILDAGGGTSQYRSSISKESDEYYVIDVDESVIEELDGRYAVVGDLHSMPFREKQFDMILLIEVLEHLYDPILAFNQIARSLKPGGIVILTTPQYWHTHGWPSDYYRYTQYGLEYLCEKNGLKVLDIKPKGGPFLLLYSVLKLNFLSFLSLPIVRVVLDTPFVLLCWALDNIFFRNNLKSRNPDSAGWGLIAQK